MPDKFFVSFPSDAEVVLSPRNRHGRQGLILDTPDAAALIAEIASSPEFQAQPKIKEVIEQLARQVEQSYSGH